MLAAVFLAALAASPVSAGEAFYAPVADAGASLPPAGLYPRGRRMAYMGYSGIPERDLANGFTAAGPVYTDEPAYLERAFKIGWPVVANVGRGHGFKDAALAARIKGQVNYRFKDQGTSLTAAERGEAEGLVELAEMLSLLKLRASGAQAAAP